MARKSKRKKKTIENEIIKDIGKFKKFLSKYKKVIIAVIIAFALFILFGGYRAWLNIHFLITDDLLINLEPNDISLNILYNEKPDVSFQIEIENSIFCNTYCSYEFHDLSDSKLVEKGSFTSSGINKNFSRQYRLSVDSIGTGQKLYRFDVACNNLRTWHCLTNEVKRQKAAFVALNYEISEYEKFLKNELRENLTKVLGELSVLDIKMQGLNDNFFELGFSINLNEISQEKEKLNQDYSDIVIETENLKRVWSTQNYTYLYELFNKSYENRIQEIDLRLIRVDNKIGDILEKHNNLVQQLNDLDNGLRELNQTLLFLHNAGEKNIVEEHNNSIRDVEELKEEIAKNAFTDYASIGKRIDEIKNSFNEII